MRAYQYFHIPSGYEAKVNDNDFSTLNNVEKIRQAFTSPTYFAAVRLGDEMVLLNASLDENKNQFIRGRIAPLSEITSISPLFIEKIPDIRLLRSDMSLPLRPFFAGNYMHRAIPLNRPQFAALFDALIQQKQVTVLTKSHDEALSILKLALYLLPDKFARGVSYAICENPVGHQIVVTDAFGRTTNALIQIVFVTKDVDRSAISGDVIDLSATEANENLSAVARMVLDTDLSNIGNVNQLKSQLELCISKDGANTHVLDLNRLVEELRVSLNREKMSEITDHLLQVDEQVQGTILPQIGELFAAYLRGEEVDDDLVSAIKEIIRQFPSLNEIVGPAIREYGNRNFLSLSDHELIDFAANLSSDESNLRQFIDETMNEAIPRRKSKRVQILHAALFLTNNYSPNLNDYILALMEIVDIRNNYQILTFEERNEGEELFYCVSKDREMSDQDLEFVAFLVYTAYVKNVDQTWKELRLLGLEKRLDQYPIMAKLRLLIQLRALLERYADLLYMYPQYAVVDLNNFYFDVYEPNLRTELKNSDYKERIRLYDEFRQIPYSSLKRVLSESLSDLSAFFDNYQELNRDEMEQLLNLFESMEANEKQAEIVDYLRSILKEYEMNASFIQFRESFIHQTYGLLSQEEQHNLPMLPSYNALISEKVAFSEDLVLYLSKFAGFTSLSNEITVKTHTTDDVIIPVAEVKSNASTNAFVAKTKLFVTLKTTVSHHKPFEVKVTIEADENTKVPAIDFVVSRFFPTSEKPGNVFKTFEGGQLKKGLFSKPKLSFVIACPPAEMGEGVFAVLHDKNEPFILQTIKEE